VGGKDGAVTYRPGWFVWLTVLAFWGFIGWIIFAPTADTDRGGSVVAYSARAATHTGPLPLDCQSACTLLLLRGCVTPAHRLTFHLPSVDHPYWRGRMAAHYPPAIAAWFLALPSGDDRWRMTGAEAIRLGVRECD
jgi:hypothetical protein